MMMEILTRKDLCEKYKLTLAFIRRHDAEMCGMGKPRRYDRELVEAFLHSYFRRKLIEHEVELLAQERVLRDNINLITRGIHEYVVRMPMRGRGGRA